MRKLICTLFILTATLVSFAQDPNFSQFFVSPLTLNPALTGKFDGVFRVAGNYRNQWPSINNAFTTYTVSVDGGILRNRIPEFDQFGIGVMAFSDKAGNGVLQNNYMALSTAYHKALDENGFHQIGLGFQGTYVNKRLNVAGLHFEDMLQSNGFTGITSEDFSGKNKLNVSYLDVNMGLLYNGTTNGSNNFYLGASMYHVNRPKESFQDGNYRWSHALPSRPGAWCPLVITMAFISAPCTAGRPMQ
jgi:type IX secretion system PorP/SprF family membrane protein